MPRIDRPCNRRLSHGNATNPTPDQPAHPTDQGRTRGNQSQHLPPSCEPNISRRKTGRVLLDLREVVATVKPDEVLLLTPFPDSDSDAAISPVLAQMMRQVAWVAPLPIRSTEPCDICDGTILQFVARDFANPRIIFGGTICSNNECTVCFIGVSDGED